MRIYLDNPATAKMSQTVINAMLSYVDGIYDRNGIAYAHSLFLDCENCGHCH